MSNVTQLHKPKDGDTCFMICPCVPGGTPFMVCAIVAENPIICSLVCPECEQGIDVVNGIVGEKQ